ncbi:MAG: hypothetical protein ACLQU1_06515 [Bryobacteraceae bacterium]
MLLEVHQLRHDIQATTVASQRVQIALCTLPMQDVAVTRAERMDDARNKCRGEPVYRQHIASDIQRLESSLAATLTAPADVPGAVPAEEAKAIQSRLSELKNALDDQTTELQACQSAEAEASIELRNDRAKLTGLQDRIERRGKSLERLGIAGE